MVNKEETIERNKNEKGATLVEYALLVTLIAIVAIAGLRLMGTTVNNKLNVISTELNATGPGVN